ncbi:MAG: hypothetical protein IJS37_00845 [Bacilli bacterium]|nr:hypothetical protein [Bacilli bacterium]
MALQTEMRFIHVIYIDGDGLSYDDIISEYRAKTASVHNDWPRIVFVQGNKNLGCDLAHAHCFSHLPQDCSHFCWLDAGDWLDAKFVAAFYRNAKKHPECGWFRFNSALFDAQSFTPLGKDAYHSLMKRYLKAKEQLPAMGFGQFTYHVMVVAKETFHKINPRCLFFGPDIHKGSFYDAQIVASLLASRTLSFYHKKCFVHIMFDPKSVSNSFVFDRSQKGLFLNMYLHKINLTPQQVSLYSNYLKLALPLSQWNARILSGRANWKEMVSERADFLSFLHTNRLPGWFYMRRYYYAMLLFVARHKSITRVYQKLRSLIR